MPVRGTIATSGCADTGPPAGRAHLSRHHRLSPTHRNSPAIHPPARHAGYSPAPSAPRPIGDGTTTTQDTISHLYTNLGTYNVLLVVTDTSTCNKVDSVKSLLYVVDPISFGPDKDAFICFYSNVLLSSGVSAFTYSWSTGEITPDIYVNTPGAYTVTVYNGGCYSSNVINVMYGEDNLAEKFPNVITPNGDNINDVIDFKKYNLGEMEFLLFDRWGTLQYKSSETNEPFKPTGLQDGTYYYILNFLSNCTGKHSTAKGFISVFNN